jgi:uncharacterized protein (DUF58 family)
VPTPVRALPSSAVVIAPLLAALLVAVLLGAALADALLVRAGPRAERVVPRVLSRGVAAALAVELGGAHGRVRVRQPAPPDLRIAAPEGDGGLATTITALRRGRHELPAVTTRTRGPLGLGRWDHRPAGPAEVLVYPDLDTARRLVLAVRDGRRREPGLRSRGPLGLGTEFERVREYVPGDDVRQVNWRATARLGRPMSNQHRIETEKEIVLLVDAGRLMAAPLGDRTRLDAALDAAAAVALVADEVGDRCGVVAFDASVLRRVKPSRGSGRKVVEAIFDLEPSARDADYELAFRIAAGSKRGWVLVLTDLLEESAARPLVDAVGVLARRHAVVVASATDPDVRALAVPTEPVTERGVLAAAVALDVLAARERAEAQVRRAGATVLEAPAPGLPAACVSAYLRAKARARM